MTSEKRISSTHGSTGLLPKRNGLRFLDSVEAQRKWATETMLVRIGRRAIESLVKEGASDVSGDEDLIHLREKGKP